MHKKSFTEKEKALFGEEASSSVGKIALIKKGGSISKGCCDLHNKGSSDDKSSQNTKVVLRSFNDL